MKRFATFLAAFCVFFVSAQAAEESRVEQMLSSMSLPEKVCQLFFVRPEDFSRLERVTKDSKRLQNAFERFPVGGVVLFGSNMQSEAQLASLNAAMQQNALAANGIGLFIGVDEEGGGVARVANKLKFTDREPAASEIGHMGGADGAAEAGAHIGGYLAELGFTLNFAPVADIRTDVKNAEITTRSFGTDPAFVSECVAAFTASLQENGILAVLKHFPGHGSASGNSHTGAATSARTVDDWQNSEWLPFQAGMQAGARMVMISHQTAERVDAALPASLSPIIVTDLLRGELGFDGVIITDALRMDAIKNNYGSGEACVKALQAGCDMLLLPYNFTNGYNGVMDALADGTLTEARIDESVRRILTLKEQCGLLP